MPNNCVILLYTKERKASNQFPHVHTFKLWRSQCKSTEKSIQILPLSSVPNHRTGRVRSKLHRFDNLHLDKSQDQDDLHNAVP